MLYLSNEWSRRLKNGIHREEVEMRILVVEDEKKIASFIKRGLEEEGYEVLSKSPKELICI